MERPILGLTNGVHGPSWVGLPIVELLEGLDANLDDLDASSASGRFWERLERIPARDLWEGHLRQKRELAIFARGRLRSQFARHGEAPAVLAELEDALDPDRLTIGFARRFATYKRAGLLFSDIDRLAHPADRPGQRVIQDIFQRSRSPQLRGRVFILEDYDMRVGRFLVQGVDVWLNNPRRPLEASGTSGMKAAQNGVPNMSVLDGWWDEGYEGDNGWAIGGRDVAADEAAQDWHDALDLYRLLEDEIVPSYYDRDAEGLPRGWLGVMRRAMATALWQFSTTRMLQEYTELLYLPAAGVPVDRPEAAPLLTEAG
jgi:starch phosphorylase